MFHNASLIYEVLRDKKTMNNNYQHPNKAEYSTQLSTQALYCLVIRFDSSVIHLNLSKYYAKCDLLIGKIKFFYQKHDFLYKSFLKDLHKSNSNNKESITQANFCKASQKFAFLPFSI